MKNELLLPYIRAVTYEDKLSLPKFSYSKIEQFLNCPMAYNFKYNQGFTTFDTSLALELGSLLHKVLEVKGHMIRDGGGIDQTILDKLIQDGIIDTDEKTREQLLGVNDLKKKYWEAWDEPDSEGATYRDKLNTFNHVLEIEMTDSDWIPIAFEQPFEFVWDNKYIIHGFIDRVDQKDGHYRVIDYKTSKKVFDEKKLPTSLQFGIYAIACLMMYGEIPVEYQYRFILLDKSQKALTIGWEKRLIKKLNDVFAKIEERGENKLWEPKPSPLCHFCNYCNTNPNAKDFKHKCEYYSLWTPSNKTFEKNKEWDPSNNDKPKRQLLIF